MSAKNLRLSWPHLVLGAIGFALSVHSWHVHNLIKAGSESGCDVNDLISCDKVLSSKYAEVFGIPLGIFGMVFFALVLLTAISTEKEFSPRHFRLIQLAISTAGIASSLALIYISKVLIGAYCPVCMAIHLTNSLLFLFSLIGFLKARRT